MWFQGLTTGTMSAVGKEGLGTPLRSASTSVKSEAPFADWLQASLLSEIPLEKLPGVNASQPVIETRSAEGELSQELLDTLLQSWLAAYSEAAIAKGGQGAQLATASPSSQSATSFADWLQASLLSAIPSEAPSGVHPNQPVNEGMRLVPGLSQETLDTLLQSWLSAQLATLVQSLLHQGEVQAGMSEPEQVGEGDAWLDAFKGALNAGDKIEGQSLPILPILLNQKPLNPGNGGDLSFWQQWLQGTALTRHIQPAANPGSLPSRVISEQELWDWLRVLLPQQGSQPEPPSSDAMQMMIAFSQAVFSQRYGGQRYGGQPLSGEDLQSVIQGAGLQHQAPHRQLNVGLNEQGQWAVNLAKEYLLQAVSTHTGSGQDGSSGQAQQEMPGTIQPSSFHTASTQGTAPSDRSFLQWLTQTEAGQNPVRETVQPFPPVRLLLSRFDTLEGRGYEARFQLYPEQLGTVHVKLLLHQGMLQAQLFVDNRLAKDALEGQLQSLQQAFAQQGLQVDRITIAVGEDSSFPWHEQGALFYQEQGNSAGQQRKGGNASSVASRYQASEGEETGGHGLYRDRTASSSHEGIDLSV